MCTSAFRNGIELPQAAFVTCTRAAAETGRHISRLLQKGQHMYIRTLTIMVQPAAGFGESNSSCSSVRHQLQCSLCVEGRGGLVPHGDRRPGLREQGAQRNGSGGKGWRASRHSAARQRPGRGGRGASRSPSGRPAAARHPPPTPAPPRGRPISSHHRARAHAGTELTHADTGLAHAGTGLAHTGTGLAHASTGLAHETC